MLKSANSVARARHSMSFGAHARRISDLSDPDENYLLLLGCQDSWFGSRHSADQIQLWRRCSHVKNPLRLRSVTHSICDVTRLVPRGAP